MLGLSFALALYSTRLRLGCAGGACVSIEPELDILSACTVALDAWPVRQLMPVVLPGKSKDRLDARNDLLGFVPLLSQMRGLDADQLEKLFQGNGVPCTVAVHEARERTRVVKGSMTDVDIDQDAASCNAHAGEEAADDFET